MKLQPSLRQTQISGVKVGESKEQSNAKEQSEWNPSSDSTDNDEPQYWLRIPVRRGPERTQVQPVCEPHRHSNHVTITERSEQTRPLIPVRETRHRTPEEEWTEGERLLVNTHDLPHTFQDATIPHTVPNPTLFLNHAMHYTTICVLISTHRETHT